MFVVRKIILAVCLTAGTPLTAASAFQPPEEHRFDEKSPRCFVKHVDGPALPESDVQRAAAQAAANYIATYYPGFDFRTTLWKLVISDGGDRWEITYFSPGVEGGAPVVVLDKRTLAPLCTWIAQ
jgi:hypothetical protein